jgi:hypothetical protein
VFVLGFDPFLNMFDFTVEQKSLGVVRACADDVGFALTSIRVLPKVASTFRFAKALAGLHIKFKKSAIVPLCEWSPARANEVKDWISAHLNEWSTINIAPAAKYLGTFLGPSIKDLPWRAPCVKWKSRVDAIATAGAPPSISASLYNTHALPVLSYVAQLAVPPRELVSQERFALSRIFHAPPNSFSRADLLNLSQWGSVHFRSIYTSLIATLVRASLKTISAWRLDYDLLASAAEEHLGYTKVIAGDFCPFFLGLHANRLNIKRCFARFPYSPATRSCPTQHYQTSANPG